MRSLTILLLIISFSATFSYAQEGDSSAWKKGGNVAFFLQQVGVKNWAGGGESAISYGSQGALFANHIDKKHTWENSFEAAYGLLKKKDIETRKNVDFLILKSKYGNFFADKWQLSGALDFRTQFNPGYLYAVNAANNIETRTLISDFLAPGYLQALIGVTYWPNERFNATFAPLSNKLTTVFNDSLSNAGAFGVERGDKLMYEFGASITLNIQRELMENVNLKSSLLMFSDYSNLSSADVFWDLFIDMKINKWLTTNFSLQMIYDDDIQITDDNGDVGPRTQIRNVLNVGIAVSFGDTLGEKKE